MSSLKVEERFVVDADVLRVWEFLKRPALVAGCLPGAKLDGQEGGDTFLGTMKIKVGPVMQDFRGKATLAEVDDTLHKMTVSGVGDDKAGGGSARMTMKCQVVPSSETGKSEVTIVAEVELFGKLVRFGRGMFEAVAKQLFKQFVDRARSAIASMPAPAGSSEPAVVHATPLPATSTGTSEASTGTSEASTGTSEASTGTSEASKPTSEASAASSEASAASSEASAVSSEASAVSSEASAASSEASAASSEASAASSEASAASSEASARTSDAGTGSKDASTASASASQAASSKSPPAVAAQSTVAPVVATPNQRVVKSNDDEALDAGSLIFAVIWEWIKGLFRRLFGRK